MAWQAWYPNEHTVVEDWEKSVRKTAVQEFRVRLDRIWQD